MLIKQDLIGRLFGRLTVVYKGMPHPGSGRSRWFCQCECGNSKLVETSSLLQGKTLSCGCLQKEKAGQTEDLIGQQFGRLLVVAREGSQGGKSTWLCCCVCGTEKVVGRRSLLSGDTKSCGCYRAEKTAALASWRKEREYPEKPVRSKKTCPACRKTKSLEEFPRNACARDGRGTYCKPCHNRIGRENRRKHHGSRGYHLKCRYGITQEDFDKMVEEQAGCCAICQSPPSGVKPWHVDHNHYTGQVRGILCHSCNTALGNFNDDPNLLRRAVEYLERGE